jgi:hypothetical protein
MIVRWNDDVAAALTSAKANVCCVSPGVEALAAPIAGLARREKMLVVSGEESHARGLAGFVAVLRGQRPKIIVNLGEARAQGAQLDARWLRLAEVIK